jgi:uncharacterized protein with PQ loop repeat
MDIFVIAVFAQYIFVIKYLLVLRKIMAARRTAMLSTDYYDLFKFAYYASWFLFGLSILFAITLVAFIAMPFVLVALIHLQLLTLLIYYLVNMHRNAKSKSKKTRTLVSEYRKSIKMLLAHYVLVVIVCATVVTYLLKYDY